MGQLNDIKSNRTVLLYIIYTLYIQYHFDDTLILYTKPKSENTMVKFE